MIQQLGQIPRMQLDLVLLLFVYTITNLVSLVVIFLLPKLQHQVFNSNSHSSLCAVEPNMKPWFHIFRGLAVIPSLLNNGSAPTELNYG
jgi:hypothetical protein